MSDPVQLEGYNTQLAAIVQNILAVREHNRNEASGTGPTGPWQQNGSPRSARHDPAEAHRLRESLLAHLSQLQILLFLDEPSVFLQSLVKKVSTSRLNPWHSRYKHSQDEPLLTKKCFVANRLRYWHALGGSRSSRYLLASPSRVACLQEIYASLRLCPRASSCL